MPIACCCGEGSGDAAEGEVPPATSVGLLPWQRLLPIAGGGGGERRPLKGVPKRSPLRKPLPLKPSKEDPPPTPPPPLSASRAARRAAAAALDRLRLASIAALRSKKAAECIPPAHAANGWRGGDSAPVTAVTVVVLPTCGVASASTEVAVAAVGAEADAPFVVAAVAFASVLSFVLQVLVRRSVGRRHGGEGPASSCDDEDTRLPSLPLLFPLMFPRCDVPPPSARSE